MAAVLSGNRNFEGRINPDVKANYLASPPLVVAYALAGKVDIDLVNDPLGEDSDGNPVYLKDIWPSQEEISETVENSLDPSMFNEQYGNVYTGNEQWNEVDVPEGELYDWDPDSTYVKEPNFFDDLSPETGAAARHRGRPRAGKGRRLGYDGPHLSGRRHPAQQPRRTVPAGERR